MIARIWQGCTRPGMGKAYMSYLEQTGLKEYRETEGFKDVFERIHQCVSEFFRAAKQK